MSLNALEIYTLLLEQGEKTTQELMDITGDSRDRLQGKLRRLRKAGMLRITRIEKFMWSYQAMLKPAWIDREQQQGDGAV